MIEYWVFYNGTQLKLPVIEAHQLFLTVLHGLLVQFPPNTSEEHKRRVRGWLQWTHGRMQSYHDEPPPLSKYEVINWRIDKKKRR